MAWLVDIIGDGGQDNLWFRIDRLFATVEIQDFVAQQAEQHLVFLGVVRVVFEAGALEPLGQDRIAGGVGFNFGLRDRIAEEGQRFTEGNAGVAKIKAVALPVVEEDLRNGESGFGKVVLFRRIAALGIAPEAALLQHDLVAETAQQHFIFSAGQRGVVFEPFALEILNCVHLAGVPVLFFKCFGDRVAEDRQTTVCVPVFKEDATKVVARFLKIFTALDRIYPVGRRAGLRCYTGHTGQCQHQCQRERQHSSHSDFPSQHCTRFQGTLTSQPSFRMPLTGSTTISQRKIGAARLLPGSPVTKTPAVEILMHASSAYRSWKAERHGMSLWRHYPQRTGALFWL